MAAPSVAQVVADRVKYYRKLMGWSQQDLADELEKLGHPLNRMTLSKIERGARERIVSLVDALALAAALNVPPPLLFLPLGVEERVAITPKVVVHPQLVVDWIAGAGPLVYSNRRARDTKTWNKHAAPLWLFRGLRDREDAVQEAQAVRDGLADDDERLPLAQERLDGALRLLDQHRDYMEQEDLRTPALPEPWAARIAELAKGRR